MQWRQIERWATIAIYVSAGVGLAILLVEALAPAGSTAQQLAHIAANRLTRLGEIGGGLLFGVALAYLTGIGGTWIMVLLMEGIERLKNRQTREQLRIEKLREGIREEGRKEVRAAVRERLEQLGIDPDDVLRPQALSQEPHPANGAAGDSISDERIRRIVRECLEQLLGGNPDHSPRNPNPPPPPAQ